MTERAVALTYEKTSLLLNKTAACLVKPKCMKSVAARPKCKNAISNFTFHGLNASFMRHNVTSYPQKLCFFTDFIHFTCLIHTFAYPFSPISYICTKLIASCYCGKWFIKKVFFYLSTGETVVFADFLHFAYEAVACKPYRIRLSEGYPHNIPKSYISVVPLPISYFPPA